MKLIDAIICALRLKNGSDTLEGVCNIVKVLLSQKDVEPSSLLAEVELSGGRVSISDDGSLQLDPERMLNRVRFFQAHAWELRNALRSMPFAQTVGLELALIYALAVRPAGVLPTIAQRGEGLWSTLNELAEEFKDFGEQHSYLLKNGGALATSPVQTELFLMASAGLEPIEYVEEMRSLLLRDSHMGQFCTPWSVAMLMARLLGDVEEVFDPAADASVLPAVLAARAPHSVKLDAVFFNQFAFFFNTLQARILGADLNAALNEPSAPGAFNKKYTHCISAPPFGGRVKEEGRLRAIEPYEIAINQILKRLAPEGKAVILVPESMLFGINRAHLRKQILDLGLLEAVISLPAGSFTPYSGIKTSIIVLNGSRPTNAPVRFVDAGLHVTYKTRSEITLDVSSVLQALDSTYTLQGVLDVKVSDIRSDEHVSWSMSRFASLLQQAHIVAEADGVDVVELGTVLSDDILSMGDLAGLPLFQVSELSTDVLDMRRTARDGQHETGSVKKGLKRLDVPALLLARVGGKLKPTLFDPVDGPIAVGSNVFMFRVDAARANTEYLATELRTPTIQDQLDAYHQGSTIAFIAKADVLRIRVRLPELKDQLRIVRERKESILLAKKEEIARQEKQHGLSTDEWQILGAVEHSFRPVVALLEQPMAEIHAVLNSLGPVEKSTITTALDTMNSGLDRMRGLFQLINAVIRSDKESLRPVPIDLRRLFRTELRGLADQVKALMVIFECEAGLETTEGVIAHVDQQQFALVIQNLFINMAKHGLRSDQEQLVVRVRVSTRIEPQRTRLVITIENNGKPFPEGFTHEHFITFGKRLDMKKGNGIGGYLIDRIIANHGGKFVSGNLPVSDDKYRSSFERDQRIDENHWIPFDREAVSTQMFVHFTIDLPISHDTV